MEILTFTYVKDTGTSERVFVPISKPSNKYFGVDVSELDEESQALFAQELHQLCNEHKAKTDELMRKYDLAHSFRQFLPEKMQNVVVEN